MAKLPFVVEPRMKPIMEEIGSEESGKIQIERRGYLTSGEKAFFQQAKQSDSGTSGLINLSRKISRATGLDMTKAYEAVVRIISGAASQEIDAKIENDFAEELSGVLRDLTNGQAHDEILMAMCQSNIALIQGLALTKCWSCILILSRHLLSCTAKKKRNQQIG